MSCRGKLQEENALSDEIVNAITSSSIGADIIDDDELEAELDELQQERLDEQMLKTGSVPVSDQIQRVPAVPGDSESYFPWPVAIYDVYILTRVDSQGKDGRCRRGRRRGGAAQTAGRDGYVRCRPEEQWWYLQDVTTDDLVAWSFCRLCGEEGSARVLMGDGFGLHILRPTSFDWNSLLALAHGGCIITRKGKTEGIYHCSKVPYTRFKSYDWPLLLDKRVLFVHIFFFLVEPTVSESLREQSLSDGLRPPL